MAQQTTLSASVRCTGIGLHTGQPVTLTLKPARADSGIVFRRSDAPRGKGLVAARYDAVADTRLGTSLCNRHGVTIATVEHLMAAFWGARIDNALIEIDGPEVPIMDGSASPFMELIARAGSTVLATPRRVIRVLKEIEVTEGKSAANVAPLDDAAQACTLEIQIDFAHPLIAQQRVAYDFRSDTFAETLSAARTFGFAHEVEHLRAQGLARGGSLQNAVVVGEQGVLNSEGLRFTDEFARHKALDCLGDLYLAGYRIEGAFTFMRPGHAINNALVRALMSDKTAWKYVSTAQARFRDEDRAFALAAYY
ncbi:MAG: UDP-3-O-acyl-N-acetylglucosamine deacetylase [Alphaproteobacteria bacterium]|nr:UDP-3-O-acyl-N-acetylglucosamine deacetylase [Alphaproteobacteria bacterium]